MKQRMCRVLILAIALVIGLMAWLEQHAQAASTPAPKITSCVNPGGTGGCYASIQAAIEASTYGAQIGVASGTYTEHITMTNGVSIYGAGWDKTIINGNFSASQPVVYFDGLIDATTVLSGVQVTGGGTGDPTTSPDGGGLHMYGSPTIINTWVNSNTGHYGGGVYALGGSPTFDNVPAWSNRALRGGGFYLTYNVVTVTSDFSGINGTVVWNSASDAGFGEGGGFYILNSKAILSGLRIYGNTADLGGGVSINSDSYPVTLLLNDISLNSASATGGGIEAYGSVQIVANLINANSARYQGGGVFCGVTCTLLSNVLTNNTVTDMMASGGGVYLSYKSASVVQNNWFEGNRALYGGGLYVSENTAVLVDANTIVSNTALGAAGVWVAGGDMVTLTNNLIARNIVSGTNYGALTVSYITSPLVLNNTIADNTGYGIEFYGSPGIVVANNIVYHNLNAGIARLDELTYTLDYNDVYSNTARDYGWGLSAGPHDQSLDPAFVGSGSMLTYYHLKPTSPVGMLGSLFWAPPYDMDGDPRSTYVSMGADQIALTLKYLYLPLIRR